MSDTVSASSSLFHVRDLTARYGEQVILEKVTMDVRRGEILAILGGSGSGKTTLLKHLIGLHQPADGQVLFEGTDLADMDEEAAERFRRRIGVLFQGGALFGSLTVEENVALPLTEHLGMPIHLAKRIAQLKLSLVQMAHAAERFPGELSGGMRKRAALARAIAMDPEVVFLDEPSAGLDPLTAADLDQLIVRLNRILGITMVVVTHELQSIFTITRRAIMLHRGGIVAEGTLDELRQSANPQVRRFLNREASAPPAQVGSWIVRRRET